MTDTVGYVRIVAANNPIHHQGTVLAVTATPVANPETVDRQQALRMVERGDAEWVEAATPPLPETPEEMTGRHAAEFAALQQRHENEDHAMRRRHLLDHESPQARSSRHRSERNALLARQGTEHRELNARLAADPPDGAAGHSGHEDLLARHGEEYRRVLERQAAEPETAALARLAEHEDLMRRQAAEHRNLLRQQTREREFAATMAAQAAAAADQQQLMGR